MYYTVNYIWQKVLDFFGFSKKVHEEEREYSVIDTVNFTDIFANKIKNLAVTDCKIQVLGTSQRAELLNNAVKTFRKKMGKITSFMLAYGGVCVVPYVVNNKLYLNTINQDNMIINGVQGDEITDCIILADVYKNDKENVTYRRYIRYLVQDGSLIVQNIALRDVTIVPLDTLPQWSNIQEFVVIQGLQKMPFAFLTCTKDNRKDEQIKGVPITFGAETQINQAKTILKEIEEEFGTKKTRIFVDEILFDKDKRLTTEYVKVMQGGQVGKNSIEAYSPDIRDTSYYNRLMNAFSLIEKSVGTSAGILTPPTATSKATATEIKAAQFDTYSIVADVHAELEKGLADFVEVCNVLADFYGLGSMGDYELSATWDYSMIESSQESFAQLAQAQAMGAVSKAEVRQFVFPNESEEEAEGKIKEIRANEPSVRETLGVV